MRQLALRKEVNRMVKRIHHPTFLSVLLYFLCLYTFTSFLAYLPFNLIFFLFCYLHFMFSSLHIRYSVLFSYFSREEIRISLSSSLHSLLFYFHVSSLLSSSYGSMQKLFSLRITSKSNHRLGTIFEHLARNASKVSTRIFNENIN